MDKDTKPADSEEKKEDQPASTEPAPTDLNASGEPDDGKPTDAASLQQSSSTPGVKKPNSFLQSLKKIRLYVLAVLLLAVIGGAYVIVSGQGKKVTPPAPNAQDQTLSQSELKKQALTGTIGNGQTVTIQGNGVLDGSELMRGNLYVAGNVQSGSELSVPALVMTSTGNFGSAQASQLQVATTAALGGATFQNGLNLNGPTTISAASVGSLTLTKILMPGNAVISVPSHLALTGASPYRTVNFGVLGNGGSASINGSDTSGTVSINTGNNPIAGCFVTMIFTVPYAQPPNIVIGPINLGAGASEHSVQPTTNALGQSTGFKICSANTPLPNQAFGFSYLVNDAPN